MKGNDNIVAPQIPAVESLFQRWALSYPGTMEDFYCFMTTPTVERASFLRGCGVAVVFVGGMVCLNYSV